MENHNSGSVLAESNLSCFLFCLGCRWQSSLEMYLFTYRCLCFKILKTKGVFNDSYMCKNKKMQCITCFHSRLLLHQ